MSVYRNTNFTHTPLLFVHTNIYYFFNNYFYSIRYTSFQVTEHPYRVSHMHSNKMQGPKFTINIWTHDFSVCVWECVLCVCVCLSVFYVSVLVDRYVLMLVCVFVGVWELAWCQWREGGVWWREGGWIRARVSVYVSRSVCACHCLSVFVRVCDQSFAGPFHGGYWDIIFFQLKFV